jgi:imidazoleglycerol-phosphate dehydratase
MILKIEKARKTKETDVTLSIEFDGSGESVIATDLPFFDHLLTSLSKHGRFDLDLEVKGDLGVDDHHVVEDVAIVLGEAVSQAQKERGSVKRFGSSIVPMDDALVLVAVDLGGRSYCEAPIKFKKKVVGSFVLSNVGHFLRSLSDRGALNLHARILTGADDHHIAEATFKGLGISLSQALEADTRLKGKVPSTKGRI